jgi:hypothetical protein
MILALLSENPAKSPIKNATKTRNMHFLSEIPEDFLLSSESTGGSIMMIYFGLFLGGGFPGGFGWICYDFFPGGS